jgi:hypothetical protein
MHTVHCTACMYVKCMHDALEGMRFAKINFLVGSGGGGGVCKNLSFIRSVQGEGARSIHI